MDLKKRLDFLADRKESILNKTKLGLSLDVMPKPERKELAILKVAVKHLEDNSRTLKEEVELIKAKQSELPSTHRAYLMSL